MPNTELTHASANRPRPTWKPFSSCTTSRQARECSEITIRQAQRNHGAIHLTAYSPIYPRTVFAPLHEPVSSRGFLVLCRTLNRTLVWTMRDVLARSDALDWADSRISKRRFCSSTYIHYINRDAHKRAESESGVR